MTDLIRCYFRPIAWFFGLFVLAGHTFAADPLRTNTWQTLETMYALILYQTPVDLARFESKIRYSYSGGGLKSLLGSSKSKESGQRVGRKIDAIYERVQEILDMNARIKKVTIKIYPDKGALAAVYKRLSGRGLNIRAWYIYDYNTIYLNAKDVHEGIVAHEMAHSIIDHYFSARPPRATAEILARYVDKHLFH